MKSLKINDIIKNIEQGKTFEAFSYDGSFTIKLNRYVPYCCTAIHNGNRVRADLIDKIALNNFERWYEEDPYTGDFIKSLPITLVVHDSRFEYDLNRSPEHSIYHEAWGKKVWKRNLTEKNKKDTIKKHANFYRVLKALVTKLEGMFDGCVVYDLHSYNYKRWDRNVPLFNVGTEQIDIKKFGATINNWLKELALIEIPSVTNVTMENDVFFGRGYHLNFLTSNFEKTLVLATEIKKVYVNEETGEEYPEIIEELQRQFKEAVVNHAHHFTSNYTNWDSNKAFNLLGKKEDPNLIKVDKQLFNLLKNFELLAFVNPKNSEYQKRKFFKSNFTEEPEFKYAPIKIYPFKLKQELSSIQTSSISDVSIRHMYEGVVSAYLDKTDLLSELNSPKFLYNSLRYFQRPSAKDIANAEYLMHLPPVPIEPKNEPFLPINIVVDKFKQALKEYGLLCKIELSNRIISKVMVLNSQKTILINTQAQLTEKQVNGLIEHEIGVHMVTTENSCLQPLKIFNIGLPVNTETQEGLAILSEILSGNITLSRLKKLALRVLVCDKMCSGASFIDCFKLLKEKHNIGSNDAYTIVTRIFRGGGFTKDYLYLSGLVKLMKFWKDGNDLSPLLVGKTSLNYYSLISEMIEREMVQKPAYRTKSLTQHVSDPSRGLYGYILSGLKV